MGALVGGVGWDGGCAGGGVLAFAAGAGGGCWRGGCCGGVEPGGGAGGRAPADVGTEGSNGMPPRPLPPAALPPPAAAGAHTTGRFSHAMP